MEHFVQLQFLSGIVQAPFLHTLTHAGPDREEISRHPRDTKQQQTLIKTKNYDKLNLVKNYARIQSNMNPAFIRFLSFSFLTIHFEILGKKKGYSGFCHLDHHHHYLFILVLLLIIIHILEHYYAITVLYTYFKNKSRIQQNMLSSVFYFSLNNI